MIIRAARKSDIPCLIALAEKAGVGLTNLISSHAYMAEKVSRSLISFKENCKQGYYFFVLEVEGIVVGCSAIAVNPGEKIPFYTYKISETHQFDDVLNIHVLHKTLHMVNDFDHETELCSLFLLPAYRNKVNGHFLSYARFLYMARFLDQFTDITFAEIRGWSDANGISPFWEAVGRKFYQMNFDKADQLTGKGKKAFIQMLKPELPIYIDLLPESAQAVIGTPHEQSAPAVHLLTKQNFNYLNYVDIFDAGPTVFTKTSQILTIQQAMTAQVITCIDAPTDELYMIAKLSGDFKVIVARIEKIAEMKVGLTKLAMKQLNLQQGEQVIMAPLFPLNERICNL